MSDEPTEKLPGDVPDTEPTVLTLMERLRSMQETMDRRHIETQGWITSIRDDINGVRGEINGVRDEINQTLQQKHELLMGRIDLLRSETEAQFRKQGHLIHVLSDSVLHSRADQRELFERIAALEEKSL
jgi:BMFP domain-containing protein YqiC